jgi:hypothetical protein
MPVGTRNRQQQQQRQQGGAGQQARQPARPLPFIACAHEHTEPGPIITKKVEKGSAAETFEFDVPSYGYYRAVFLLVELTGGSLGTGELSLDFPWTVIEQLTLLDTNGAPIYGPLAGFNNLISQLYDGFTYQQDPRADPQFVSTINAFFKIRIPTEIAHHSGVGSLGNQNASAPYRIRLTVGAESTIFKKEPSVTFPTVKITPILEAWTLPNRTDSKGRPQSQLPPSYGTVMFHSERVVGSIPSGQFQVPVLRVGGLIRWICFIGRKTSSTGERTDKVLPSNPILFWDGRQLYNEPKSYRISRSVEPLQTPIGATGAVGGRPAGVLAYTFNRTALDRCGDERPYLYLPTTEATRLELEGSWEEAGVVQVLTCEVAPAEVNPAQRYVESNATAFHPMGGTPNPSQV